MKYTPQILTIALQKQILRLVDAGQSYEQIRAALHVTSTSIARVITRRQAFRDKMVDTPYHGQPMNTSGREYVPTPEEIAERAAIVRKRHKELAVTRLMDGNGRLLNEEQREPEPVEIQEVRLVDLGVWVHGGERVTR